jgi:hypothetical protein
MLKSSLPVCTAFLLIAQALPALAQSQQQRTQPKNQLDQMQASGEYRVLTKPIDLPNFPAYGGGGQFLWGNLRYKKDGGAEVTLRYAATDPASAVLTWYKQSMINFHWTVGQTTERMTTGRYKGMTATIVTFPSNNPQYACQINVVFNMPKQAPAAD